MSDPKTMLRLALTALDREVPNVELARGILRDLAGAASSSAAAPARDGTAVTIAQAAERLGYCAATVRRMIGRGELAAIGRGRGTRILIDQVLSPRAASVVEQAPADEFAVAAAHWGAGVQ